MSFTDYGRSENFDDFSEGICRFIIGLSKKVILANNLALLADTIFKYNASDLSVLSAWLGAFAYTMQIYFDFSGYSDMAIGLGRMFGFHFLENFNFPYISTTVSEFWRRWHISMGSWFRDYVYFPLGGSRVKKHTRLVFNLFCVWFLTGLWHGANWTFILWGLMYFVLISIEKCLSKKDFHICKFCGHVYTMFFVIIGWVIFKSNSIISSGKYILSMFGASKNSIIDNTFILLFKQFGVILVIATMLSVYTKKIKMPEKIKEVCLIVFYILAFLVSASYVIKGGYNPFIYFNF